MQYTPPEPPTGMFTPAVAFISAALGAFGLWLANRMLGKAAFQTAINTGFRELTDQLQEERSALRKELGEAKIERDDLRGEIRQLKQRIESLLRLLDRHGIKPEDGA